MALYIPDAFRVEDPEVIHALLDAHGFGTLLTATAEGRLWHSQTPFLVESDRRALIGHLASANPHTRELASVPRSTVLFQGPHCYISPSWYASGFHVPTWNYATVAVTGRVEPITEPLEVLRFLRQLVDRYESEERPPWRMDETDPQISRLTGAIVCFRVVIEEVDAKFKMSQNKRLEDRESLLAHLSQHPGEAERAVADLLAETLSWGPVNQS